jgi:hypothetical protein
MYTGNLIYQAERPLSRAEQQQADIANAELVRAVSRCWHALAAPLRALRSAWRPARRQAGLPAGYPAAGYQPAESLAECQAAQSQAGECLPGRAA